MKHTKYTPGPWHIANYGCSPDYFAIKKGSFTLATKIITEQDARLIAAAPYLLAALQGLLADPYLSDPINVDRMKSARAAIAKATGQA